MFYCDQIVIVAMLTLLLKEETALESVQHWYRSRVGSAGILSCLPNSSLLQVMPDETL
uniref:Uncharacterized protein n=1 Tax=Rhizophora mucronata TaxID=61149 RepID=A0A2P2IX34_RHIMU